MELDSVSFPTQRSCRNELPVPPLLLMSPAAHSRHKHVTIMLSHSALSCSAFGRKGGWLSQTLLVMRERELSVRERVMEGVRRKDGRRHFPSLPQEGWLCDHLLVSSRGPSEGTLMRTCEGIMFSVLMQTADAAKLMT